jgi:hypothetical protein
MAKNKYIEREGRYAGLREQKKADVQIVMSGHMPEWARDHREYWKAADKYERANGRLYKQIEFSLPIELTPDEREKTAQGFAEYLTSKEQLPYTLAIHIDDPQNPHCHLMISERANDGIARSSEVWFSRANSRQPEKGGAKKTTSLMPEEWLIDTRAAWAEIANKSLERAGSVERIDHRTLAAQGIDREPTAHRGVHGEAKRHHQKIQQLEAELSEAKVELAELERQEKWEADVQPSISKVSAEVRTARFDTEPAAPMAATPEPWAAAEMSEIWPDVQAPVSAEARGVRFVPPPKPDIEVPITPIGETEIATLERPSLVGDEAATAAEVTPLKPEIEGATVAPISGKMASSTSKPGKAPKPGAAIEVPAPALRATPEEQRDVRTQRATSTGVEVARGSSTSKPGEAPEAVSPRVSVTPIGATKIAEGIERAKARFANRQAREAEEKRRQEAEIDRQRKERQTLEKRAREEELKRKREEERQKRIDLDREGGWSR